MATGALEQWSVVVDYACYVRLFAVDAMQARRSVSDYAQSRGAVRFVESHIAVAIKGRSLANWYDLQSKYKQENVSTSS